MAHDAIVAIRGVLGLPAMMGNGFKDDTILHESWRSEGFTVDRSVVVDFKYAFFTRSQAGIYKQAMMKGAAAIIKKKRSQGSYPDNLGSLCLPKWR